MNICKKCKHVEIAYPHPCITEYWCKQHPILNPITGDINYDVCLCHNPNGDCNRYEPKKSFIQKLKELIKL